MRASCVSHNHLLHIAHDISHLPGSDGLAVLEVNGFNTNRGDIAHNYLTGWFWVDAGA
jgi:hypothetical protein